MSGKKELKIMGLELKILIMEKELNKLKELMNTFIIDINKPIIKYDCCVCLESYEENQYINFKCTHGLCKSCYREVEICPLCRKDIEEI